MTLIALWFDSKNRLLLCLIVTISLSLIFLLHLCIFCLSFFKKEDYWTRCRVMQDKKSICFAFERFFHSSKRFVHLLFLCLIFMIEACLRGKESLFCLHGRKSLFCLHGRKGLFCLHGRESLLCLHGREGWFSLQRSRLRGHTPWESNFCLHERRTSPL